MRADIQLYCKEIENNIDKLIRIYEDSHNDLFFTEKELHSYFYHLCLESKIFIIENGFSLIHTEYPTPFKCKKDNLKLIDYAGIDENKIRGHIDFVVLNPNFVNWIIDNKKDIKYLTGLTNGSFSKYIIEFSDIYIDFQSAFNEPILLFALEFKYIRHGFSGTKYPKNEIRYDIAKLDLLKNKKLMINGRKIHFCLKTLSLAFIGHRIISDFKEFSNEIKDKDCRIINKTNNYAT